MVSIHGHFGFRSWLSMIFGLALVVLGLIPFLYSLGVIGFTLPAISQFIIRVIFLVAGLLLLWDASKEVYTNSTFMMMSLVCGIPMVFLGAIPVMYYLGWINWNIEFIGGAVLHIITAVAGLILFFDAWKSE